MRCGTKVGVLVLVMVCSGVVRGEVFTFQQGVGGYEGGVDATIYSSTTYANQVGAGRLRVEGGLNAEHANTLIRFGGLEGVLAGRNVGRATLTLTFQYENPLAWTRAVVDIYQMIRPWNGDNVSWTVPDGADPNTGWGLAGAQEGGVDRGDWVSTTDMGNRYRISSTNKLNYDDEARFEFELDPWMVKGWVDYPEENYGVIVVMNSGYNSDVLFSSNEDVDAEEGYAVRPLLTVYECTHELAADFNGDCYVDMGDFGVMVAEWLGCEGMTTDVTGDGCVDVEDLKGLADEWLSCTDPSNANCVWCQVDYAADFDKNCCVDVGDLAVMLGKWATTGATQVDLNGNGKVEMGDFAVLCGEWLMCEDGGAE